MARGWQKCRRLEQSEVTAMFSNTPRLPLCFWFPGRTRNQWGSGRHLCAANLEQECAKQCHRRDFVCSGRRKETLKQNRPHAVTKHHILLWPKYFHVQVTKAFCDNDLPARKLQSTDIKFIVNIGTERNVYSPKPWLLAWSTRFRKHPIRKSERGMSLRSISQHWCSTVNPCSSGNNKLSVIMGIILKY